MNAWFKHHFVCPDLKKVAEKDLEWTRLELHKSALQLETAAHSYARLLDTERRLADYCGVPSCPPVAPSTARSTLGWGNLAHSTAEQMLKAHPELFGSSLPEASCDYSPMPGATQEEGQAESKARTPEA